jgi:hypothetical protein
MLCRDTHQRLKCTQVLEHQWVQQFAAKHKVKQERINKPVLPTSKTLKNDIITKQYMTLDTSRQKHQRQQSKSIFDKVLTQIQEKSVIKRKNDENISKLILEGDRESEFIIDNIREMPNKTPRANFKSCLDTPIAPFLPDDLQFIKNSATPKNNKIYITANRGKSSKELKSPKLEKIFDFRISIDNLGDNISFTETKENKERGCDSSLIENYKIINEERLTIETRESQRRTNHEDVLKYNYSSNFTVLKNMVKGKNNSYHNLKPRISSRFSLPGNNNFFKYEEIINEEDIQTGIDELPTYEAYINPIVNKHASSIQFLENIKTSRSKRQSEDVYHTHRHQTPPEDNFWSKIKSIFNPFQCNQ